MLLKHNWMQFEPIQIQVQKGHKPELYHKQNLRFQPDQKGVEEEATTLAEVEVEADKVLMTKIYKISHPSDYHNVNQTEKN